MKGGEEREAALRKGRRWPMPVRWNSTEMAVLEAAAARLECRKAEVVRRGALRFAEAVIGGEDVGGGAVRIGGGPGGESPVER